MNRLPEDAQKFHILINAGSGGAMKIGAQKFDALVKNTGLGIESFSLTPSDRFNDRLEELAASPVPVLIGGGDGTIAHAAGVHMKLNKPFGILPMGTMNLLARDLGVPTVLESGNIFDLYQKTRLQAIDAGTVNDRPFLCCAAIGTIPEAAVFRENIRHVPDVLMVPRLTAYIMDRMDVANMRDLQILADGREMNVQTSALVISNNRFAHSRDAAHRLAKNSLQDGTLGIYCASPQTLFERIRLLLNLQQGKLETEPSVQESQAMSVHVKTGNDEELVSVDGEPVKLKTPLSFRILDGALKIITPVMEDAALDQAGTASA